MQTIVNLGTGGADLNGQNGSTTSADSNDALFLDWPGDNGGNYVYLPGVAGNNLSQNYDSALDLTGDDLEIIMHLACDDWTPAANSGIVARYGGSGDRSWYVRLNTNGTIQLTWYTDGTTGVTSTSSAFTFSDAEAAWIKVTLDGDNGAGGYDCAWYTSADGGLTWSQHGSTDTGASTTTVWNGSSALFVGGLNGSLNPLAAKIYRVIVNDGIGGSANTDIDTSVIASGSASSFVERSSNGSTIAINRSASGRKTVAVVSPAWLFGTDDFMEVADNALLDFGASDSFTLLAVVRQWATPTSNGVYLSKHNASASLGFDIRSNGTAAQAIVRAGDGTNVSATSPTFDLGDITLLSSVLDRSGSTLVAAVDTSTGAFSSTSTLGAVNNTGAMRIGRQGVGGGLGYQDFELLCIAIFRRILTSSEIGQLSTYYANRLS